MFVKDYSNVPNVHGGDARTLSSSIVTRTDTDWIVNATVHEDYYEWINDFSAYNKKTGEIVAGNFESIVIASSEKTLNDFLNCFPYEEWDYWDI
jgi:hypothetical protein